MLKFIGKNWKKSVVLFAILVAEHNILTFLKLRKMNQLAIAATKQPVYKKF